MLGVVLAAGLWACESSGPGGVGGSTSTLMSVADSVETSTAATTGSSVDGTAVPSSVAAPTTTSSVPSALPTSSTTSGAATSCVACTTESVEPSLGTAADTSDVGLVESSSREPGDSSAAGISSDVDATCQATFNGERPAPLTLSGNTFAHDPTMIKAGDTYYRFWTGDYVPSAKSTDLRNWVNAPSVYDEQYPNWVSQWRSEHPDNTFNFPWAPDVSYFGGKYHLYSSFSAFFGRNSSCITHLSTTDLAAGEWTDHGPVICSESGDAFNAIDADVGFTAEGAPYLAFGSFWDGIFAFALDDAGNRVGSDVTRLAWASEIEAPVLFYRCGFYYLFVSHGLCCPGENRSIGDLTYRVVVGRSENILGPYVDRDGVALLDGGGTVVVQGDHVTYAAAGHGDVLVDGETVYHLYHAYRQSDAGAELRIVQLPFDSDGWPVGGAP